jgi:hypothetical protein
LKNISGKTTTYTAPTAAMVGIRPARSIASPAIAATERDAGLRERKESAKDPSHQSRRRVLLDHGLEDGIDRASCEPAD